MNNMRYALLSVSTVALASVALAQHHDEHKDNSRQNQSNHSSGGSSWNRGGSNQRSSGGRFSSNQGYGQRNSGQSNQRYSGGSYQNRRTYGGQGYSSLHGQPDQGMRQQYNWLQQSQRQGIQRPDGNRFNYTGGGQQHNSRTDGNRYNYSGGSFQRQGNYRSSSNQYNYTGGGYQGRNNRWNGSNTANQSYRQNPDANGRVLQQQDYNRNVQGNNGDWRDGHHNLNGWHGNEWWRNNGSVRIYCADRFHNYDNWRFGYYQYNPYWNDNSFYFSFYSFTPYDPCVVSPWYVYPALPPYIAYNRVYVLNGGATCPWNGGNPYNYNPGYNPDSYGNPDLNFAIDQITQAFNTGNDTDLNRVIPSDSRVNIYNEGNYMYSVNGGDFYNMLMDNIHGTRTQRYAVINVRIEGDDAIVSARHDYYNPYNGVSSAYQMFRLRPSGEGYVVTDFMTSATPIGGSAGFGGW